MTKPTPLPWCVEVVGTGGSHDNPRDLAEVKSVDGRALVAELLWAEDAALIVQAVNNHATLVEALREVMDCHRRDATQAGWVAAIDKCRRAIEAAGVKP